MKPITYIIPALALTLLSCKREIENPVETLVTPRIDFTVSENPFTGLLAVYPCQDGSSIYYGNYKNGQLSPIYANYVIGQGNILQSNPPLTLPTGNYYLLYWGVSKAITEAYDAPAVVEPPMIIGVDTKTLSFGLRKNLNDTTYMPTFDYVFNARSTQIGNQSLSVPLRRAVAGLKINIRRDNNKPLDPSISSIDILVSNIALKLNLYDATPSDYSATVTFPLTIADNRMSASNSMVTLFPSNIEPSFAIVAKLNNGQQKIYRTTLNNVLTPGTNVTITVDMGEILVEETSGNGFTVSAWNEQSETINTGPI